MTLLERYDVLLLDLDGVVYRGRGAVPFAIEVLRAAQESGTKLGYVTNNAARPAAEVAEHLTELGLPSAPEQVVTSAQVGAELLADQIPPGAPVLAIGGFGVALALREAGLQPVRAGDELASGLTDRQIADSVRGVLQGFGPDVSWRDLAVAAYAVEGGATWVATNLDRTIPRADGIAPGNGTLVAAVSAATGVIPPAAGKPAAAMMLRAGQRLAARRPLVIGDRLDTDIAGARAAGMDSLLVGTGVTTPEQLIDAPANQRPTYVSADLRGLVRDLPDLSGGAPVGDSADQELGELVCAGWRDPSSVPLARLTELLAGEAGT